MASKSTIGNMTRDDLRSMISELLEEKLLDLLGDPDEGLELRKSIRDRLARQRARVEAGDRGEPFDDVLARLGLD